MPKNLVGDTTNFPTQTAPLGGESRTSASVETPFQNAADRTAWIKARLDYIDPSGNGARRLRNVESIAQLRALTDLTSGVCIVDGIGLYVYRGASTATAREPFVITPTSVGGGAGRWEWEALATLNVAYGLPQLDADARLPTSRLAAAGGGSKILGASVANGLVDLYTSSAAGPYSTTSTSYVTVGSIAVAFTMVAGDRALIFGQAFGYQQDLTPAQHFTQWLVTKPDASTAVVAESEMKTKASALTEYVPRPFGTYYTAVADGVHTFVLQQKTEGASGGATVSIANMNVVALLVRP